MENRERKKKNRVIIGGGGGDIGAVVFWGGAMAVTGVVAAFAAKRRFGWGRKDSKDKEEEEIKKNEQVKNGEEEKEKAKVIDSMLNVKKIDSVDLVSALLGEKPKDDVAKQRSTAPHQDIVPIINYAIPAIPTHPEIVDPYTTLNPDFQEIIHFSKLKPEFIAGIVEECKSLVIDKVDPPVPLKDAKVPVERLILKPIISQATLEAEPLLSPIKEVEEPGDEGGEGKEEIEDENEDEGEEEFIEEASGESSSAFNDEAIWPAEMIEELSRELKEMKIDLESNEEEGVISIDRKHEIVDETHKNRDVGNDEEEKVVPVATTWTVVKLARTRVLLLSGFVLLLLLVLLIFRFDAMSRVFHET